MKIVYQINKVIRRFLLIWMLVIFLIVSLSQVSRFIKLYSQEVNIDQLEVQVEHLDEGEYRYYSEAVLNDKTFGSDEESWQGAVVCIDKTKTYWNLAQMKNIPENKNTIHTSIDVLTVTIRINSVLFRDRKSVV